MKRAYRRRYHYIYKTTCVVTGKYYLGMHSTDDLNDNYVGSGKRLWYSINKHGIENHVCEILEHYFTREWLREREAELVCAETLTDPMCMNLKLGGDGGFDNLHRTGNKQGVINISSEAARAKATANTKKWYSDRPEKYKERSQRVVDQVSVAHQAIEEKYGCKSVFSVLNSSEEFQEKRKAKFAEIGHQSGSKNSQYGSCWISDGKTAQKIAKETLPEWLAKGWLPGRKKQ